MRYTGGPTIGAVINVRYGVRPLAFRTRARVKAKLHNAREQDRWLEEHCAGRFVPNVIFSQAGWEFDVEFEDTNDALLWKLTWSGEVLT